MRRRFGPPVRLEVEEDIDPTSSTCWSASSTITEAEVYRAARRRSTSAACSRIADLDRPELNYPSFVAGTPPRPAPRSRRARRRHLRRAARARRPAAPPVRLVLHLACRRSSSRRPPTRTCSPSSRPCTAPPATRPIVDALIDAAESGKQVLALVEIKARFDEQANIDWARKLEKAGVPRRLRPRRAEDPLQAALVVRQEGDGLRRYCHIGTGNYNPKTARLYEDLGLLTADPQVGEDLTRLFNQLSGYAPRDHVQAPAGRPAVAARRADRPDRRRRSPTHQAGRPARIRIKVNSIVDEAHHRRPLPGVAGRRAGRRLGARHLRPPARGAGPQREHPGALDPRPLPGALPRLLLRQRRRARRSASAAPT